MRKTASVFGLGSLGLLMVLAVAGCAAPERGAKSGSAGGRARAARPPSPRVGEVAPGFDLRMLENESKRVKLASFAGEKPVILFFGSYT